MKFNTANFLVYLQYYCNGCSAISSKEYLHCNTVMIILVDLGNFFMFNLFYSLHVYIYNVSFYSHFMFSFTNIKKISYCCKNKSQISCLYSYRAKYQRNILLLLSPYYNLMSKVSHTFSTWIIKKIIINM